LREEDRQAFDKMMDCCRLHASAGGQAARADPVEVMFMSILLEHQRRLESIEAKLERVLKGLGK
jgi:hypothetical protein